MFEKVNVLDCLLNKPFEDASDLGTCEQLWYSYYSFNNNMLQTK